MPPQCRQMYHVLKQPTIVDFFLGDIISRHGMPRIVAVIMMMVQYSQASSHSFCRSPMLSLGILILTTRRSIVLCTFPRGKAR